jgi:L-lactate dehydrogenase complex protein LldG
MRDADREKAVAARIAARFRHPTPGRVAGKSHDDNIALFKQHMIGQSATILDAASMADVPSLIANYLRQYNLPARISMGDDATLNGLPWSKEPSLTRKPGRAAPDDEVSLSHATAGVAETGTLFMASGPDNPVTLNFLPETHIVVVRGADVVGGYEDVWDRLRAAGPLPRTVNWISGPSRTADIEQTIVMGAHGPRRLHVILAG